MLISRHSFYIWVRKHDSTTTFIAVVVTLTFIIALLNLLSGKGL